LIFLKVAFCAAEELSGRELFPQTAMSGTGYQRQEAHRKVTQTQFSGEKCEVGFSMCMYVLRITMHN
jgi:hypothetical protein